MCVWKRWQSVGSAVNVVWIGACACVCVLETPKPPLTPDLLKSHDTPSIPTKHSEWGGAKVKQGNNQLGLGGIPNT